MAKGTVLLFYKYVSIEYPKQVVKWQKKLCQELGLTGRIFVGHEGINGTLGGTTESTERYKTMVLEHPLFGDVDFKESEGGAHCFSKLYIVVRKEIVHLGLDTEQISPAQGGQHLTPEQVHALIARKPDNLVILDARNDYEWEIGKFKDAITPPIKNFREFPEYIDQNIEQFKDKDVLMYCTGGIRCERATSYLNAKNVANTVYQISGGIHRYVEQYPDGFFRGKNYVFDHRISLKVNDDILGSCLLCATPCDDYANCLNAQCNKHFISCAPCLQKFDGTCSEQCNLLIKTGQTTVRPAFNVVKPSSIRTAEL
jgi:predicted sulfurtransferase